MGQFRDPFTMVSWSLSTCLVPNFRVLFLVRYFYFSFKKKNEIVVLEKHCGPESFGHRSSGFKFIKL